MFTLGVFLFLSQQGPLAALLMMQEFAAEEKECLGLKTKNGRDRAISAHAEKKEKGGTLLAFTPRVHGRLRLDLFVDYNVLIYHIVSRILLSTMPSSTSQELYILYRYTLSHDSTSRYHDD